MDDFFIRIPLKGVPKPRMTGSDAWKDPPRPSVQKYRDFADATRAQIVDVRRYFDLEDDEQFSGPVRVSIEFLADETRVFIDNMPLTKPRGKRAGDIDNMIKSVLEGLQDWKLWKGIIADDSQVVKVTAKIEEE